tara:strand:- start:882 stop:2750 length:1869 start_codon:yes stop_codon:yes gene_type:complete
MAEKKENKIQDIFSGKSEFEIPKMDTRGIDEAIRKISTPSRNSGVYEKLAAMYRDRGEGAILRRQKNIANVFGPALELYKQRKNAADEAFATNLENSPEIDDSYIFGEQTGTPMPITDEIKGLSGIIRKDLRDLSNLNPTDPRYAELRKQIEENQDKIVKYNDLNKKILGIRNSEVERANWSQGMKEEEVRMWDDIYSSNGRNIQMINGKPTYVDPVNGQEIDLATIGDSPVEKNEQAAIDYTNYDGIINNYALTGAGMNDFNYDKIIGGAFRFLGNLDNTKIRSLIFDGYNLDPIEGGGPVTTDFLNTVIQQKYGNEINTPEEFLDKLNEIKSIGINKAEFGEERNKTLKQLFIEFEQQKAIETIKSGDVSTVFSTDESGGFKTEKKSKKNRNNNKIKSDKGVSEFKSIIQSLDDNYYNNTKQDISKLDNFKVSDIGEFVHNENDNTLFFVIKKGPQKDNFVNITDIIKNREGGVNFIKKLYEGNLDKLTDDTEIFNKAADEVNPSNYGFTYVRNQVGSPFDDKKEFISWYKNNRKLLPDGSYGTYRVGNKLFEITNNPAITKDPLRQLTDINIKNLYNLWMDTDEYKQLREKAEKENKINRKSPYYNYGGRTENGKFIPV